MAAPCDRVPHHRPPLRRPARPGAVSGGLSRAGPHLRPGRARRAAGAHAGGDGCRAGHGGRAADRVPARRPAAAQARDNPVLERTSRRGLIVRSRLEILLLIVTLLAVSAFVGSFVSGLREPRLPIQFDAGWGAGGGGAAAVPPAGREPGGGAGGWTRAADPARA